MALNVPGELYAQGVLLAMALKVRRGTVPLGILLHGYNVLRES
jgi:hypothetical protein